MYLDVYFLVNLLMDRFSLACALRQYKLPGCRLWLGAVVGALGACLWEVAGLPTAFRPVGALFLAGAMVGVSVGKRSVLQWSRALIEVYGYSFLFAGIIPYVSRLIPVWTGAVLVSYVGIRVWLWWQERKSARVISVIFEAENERREMMAVIDTGHQLREPITGRPVIIVRNECVPKTVNPAWPVCFESVQGKGIMMGFWPEKLWIGKKLYKKKEILVAVAAEWKEKNWDALVPGYVME